MARFETYSRQIPASRCNYMHSFPPCIWRFSSAHGCRQLVVILILFLEIGLSHAVNDISAKALFTGSFTVVKINNTQVIFSADLKDMNSAYYESVYKPLANGIVEGCAQACNNTCRLVDMIFSEGLLVTYTLLAPTNLSLDLYLALASRLLQAADIQITTMQSIKISRYTSSVNFLGLFAIFKISGQNINFHPLMADKSLMSYQALFTPVYNMLSSACNAVSLWPCDVLEVDFADGAGVVVYYKLQAEAGLSVGQLYDQLYQESTKLKFDIMTPIQPVNTLKEPQTARFVGGFTIQYIDGAPALFTPTLMDQTSIQYKALYGRIVLFIMKCCSALSPSPCSVLQLEFNSGSILTRFSLVAHVNMSNIELTKKLNLYAAAEGLNISTTDFIVSRSIQQSVGFLGSVQIHQTGSGTAVYTKQLSDTSSAEYTTLRRQMERLIVLACQLASSMICIVKGMSFKEGSIIVNFQVHAEDTINMQSFYDELKTVGLQAGYVLTVLHRTDTNLIQITSENFCARNPCQNGGVCSSHSNGFFYCTCMPPFTGDYCHLSLACLSRPCVNNSTCYNIPDITEGYKCVCLPFTSGINCQIVSPPWPRLEPPTIGALVDYSNVTEQVLVGQNKYRRSGVLQIAVISSVVTAVVCIFIALASYFLRKYIQRRAIHGPVVPKPSKDASVMELRDKHGRLWKLDKSPTPPIRSNLDPDDVYYYHHGYQQPVYIPSTARRNVNVPYVPMVYYSQPLAMNTQATQEPLNTIDEAVGASTTSLVKKHTESSNLSKETAEKNEVDKNHDPIEPKQKPKILD